MEFIVNVSINNNTSFKVDPGGTGIDENTPSKVNSEVLVGQLSIHPHELNELPPLQLLQAISTITFIS
jgi:hypothetical protein